MAADEWGDGQSGEDVIQTGASFTLNGISCDTYDLRLVDEDQHVCDVPSVDFAKMINPG